MISTIMGRYYSDKRIEVEDCKNVDVFWLKKHGYLSCFKSGGITWKIYGEEHSIGVDGNVLDEDDLYVRLYYRITRFDGETKQMDYKVPLVRTKCYFGGFRYWFICPIYNQGIYCGRRVAILYKDGDYFTCRKCSNLAYRSQNENKKTQFHYLYSLLNLEQKLEKLNKKIKVRIYNGKPTRKYRRFLKLLRLYD